MRRRFSHIWQNGKLYFPQTVRYAGNVTTGVDIYGYWEFVLHILRYYIYLELEYFPSNFVFLFGDIFWCVLVDMYVNIQKMWFRITSVCDKIDWSWTYGILHYMPFLISTRGAPNVLASLFFYGLSFRIIPLYIILGEGGEVFTCRFMNQNLKNHPNHDLIICT